MNLSCCLFRKREGGHDAFLAEFLIKNRQDSPKFIFHSEGPEYIYFNSLSVTAVLVFFSEHIVLFRPVPLTLQL